MSEDGVGATESRVMDNAEFALRPRRLGSSTRSRRHGALALPLDGGRGAVPRLHVVGPDNAPTTSAAASLLERTVELDLLRGAITRLSAGHGGVVLLEAAAGLGKSALLR